MKKFNALFSSILTVATFLFVAFGFTLQSAKSAPMPWLVNIGGCCYEVHYSLPLAEANLWRTCQIAVAPGFVNAAGAVGMFAVSPTPAPMVTFTHGGAGWFPVGPNLFVGTVCFTTPGPALVTIRFTDKFGNMVVYNWQINCAPIVGNSLGGSNENIHSDESSVAKLMSFSSGSSNLMNDLAEVSPNPATENANIALNLTNDVHDVALYVLDASGRKVLDVNTGSSLNAGLHNFAIQTQGLANGTYYVVLRSDEGIHSKTLQVLR